ARDMTRNTKLSYTMYGFVQHGGLSESIARCCACGDDGVARGHYHVVRKERRSEGRESRRQGCGRSEGEGRGGRESERGAREGGRSARSRDRRLYLRLSTRHDGNDAPRDDQCREGGRHTGADGPVRTHAELSRCDVPRRDGPECGHPLHDDVGRRVERAVDI